MRRLIDHVGLRRIETERPSVPRDTVVFAIGDIHGRVDLLVKAHQQILNKSKDLPSHLRKVVVYLGDYIDYGPESSEVIDTLISGALPGFRSIYLLGNHELSLLSYLKGEMDFLRWSNSRHETKELPNDYLISPQLSEWLYEKGGLATLQSYGVKTKSVPDAKAIAEMRFDLLRKIPTDHIEFLENLELSHSFGDFFFVHAGVDPSRPLNEQNPSDLLTIGERFLDSRAILDKVIVHGHTPFPNACVRPNRISLDTEAHKTGLLSGLMIRDDQFSIFSAS